MKKAWTLWIIGLFCVVSNEAAAIWFGHWWSLIGLAIGVYCLVENTRTLYACGKIDALKDIR